VGCLIEKKQKEKEKDYNIRDYDYIIIRRHNKMEALSVDIERKVKALVDAGYYSNKSEVIKNAVISLFRENTELNVTVAIELYKKGEVSLSKAAEIAGMTTIEFKEILGKRGFTREIEARPAEEMDEKLRKYL
jgi:predicted HTH domain antitoxin